MGTYVPPNASKRAKNLLEYEHENPLFHLDPNADEKWRPKTHTIDLHGIAHNPEVHRRVYSVGCCTNKRYAKLDDHAINCPDSETETVQALASYLTQVARNTEEKARVLHRWIAQNVSYNVEGLHSSSRGDTSAEGVLQSRTSVCQGYATLFKALCAEAGVECEIISGVSKGVDWHTRKDSQEIPESDHAWNAVYLPEQKGWALLDCTWAAGYIDHEDHDFHFSYDDVYFLTRPDWFIIDHLPCIPQGELAFLEAPMGWSKFRTLMGNLRNGWVPKSYIHSEVECAVSNQKPTLFALDFENFKGNVMHMKNCVLTCLPYEDKEMPDVQASQGRNATLVITLPRVTSMEPGEACPFSLKGTINIIKSHDIETTLTGWASQTRFTPDSFEYHLHAVVASMDQEDPLWPGPQLPEHIPTNLVNTADSDADNDTGAPRKRKNRPAAANGNAAGYPIHAASQANSGPHGLPPEALAAAAAQSKSKKGGSSMLPGLKSSKSGGQGSNNQQGSNLPPGALAAAAASQPKQKKKGLFSRMFSCLS